MKGESIQLIRDTVIDYVMGEVRIGDWLESLSIGEEVDSDHHPLIVTSKDRAERRKRGEGGRRGQRREEWNEGGREKFREAVAGIGVRRDKDRNPGVEEEIVEGGQK